MNSDDIKNCFENFNALCVASGPSLVEKDCLLFKYKKEFITIVTNSTFRMCPWADFIFAFDSTWVKNNQEDVLKNTLSTIVTVHGCDRDRVISLRHKSEFKAYGNSGTGAISLAAYMGIKKIYMLGYDCKKVDNKNHWHEDHKGLSNCQSIKTWPSKFAQCAAHVRYIGSEVFNLSRNTALTCFEKMSIESIQ